MSLAHTSCGSEFEEISVCGLGDPSNTETEESNQKVAMEMVVHKEFCFAVAGGQKAEEDDVSSWNVSENGEKVGVGLQRKPITPQKHWIQGQWLLFPFALVCVGPRNAGAVALLALLVLFVSLGLVGLYRFVETEASHQDDFPQEALEATKPSMVWLVLSLLLLSDLDPVLLGFLCWLVLALYPLCWKMCVNAKAAFDRMEQDHEKNASEMRLEEEETSQTQQQQSTALRPGKDKDGAMAQKLAFGFVVLSLASSFLSFQAANLIYEDYDPALEQAAIVNHLNEHKKFQGGKVVV